VQGVRSEIRLGKVDRHVRSLMKIARQCEFDVTGKCDRAERDHPPMAFIHVSGRPLRNMVTAQPRR
jgi:hypothetical protein